jgi:nucleoside-diphosphate-sugar epimerase
MHITEKQILVTGASGYIGTRLCERLVTEYDCKVVGMARETSDTSHLKQQGVSIVTGNILDTAFVNRVTKDVDVVINLVSGDLDTIIRGSRNIAKAARQSNVSQFIHMSSAAIYGLQANPAHLSHATPKHLTGNPYSDAKIIAERVVTSEVSRGLPVIGFRPRVVWGPGSFWVKQFTQYIRNGKFYLVNNGEGACNSIYIDNLIDAIIAAIIKNVVSGKFYYITDNERITWRDYYTMLAKSSPTILDFENYKVDATDPLFADMYKTSKYENIKLLVNYTRLGIFVSRALSYFSRKIPSKLKRAFWVNYYTKKTSTESNSHLYETTGVNEQRILRESGDTFTDISQIKRDLEYVPKYGFEEAMVITNSWLHDFYISEKH